MHIVKLALAALLAATMPVTAGEAPLPAGKPAGVQAAISRSDEIIYLGLAAVAAAGMGLLLLGKKNGGVSLSNLATATTTTTTTSP